MVDQPGSGPVRSYKIRGHTRRKRATKPYARPSEVKKKSLLDTVKDYLSPSWLFGYLQTNEQEDLSDSEEELDDECTVNDEGFSAGPSERSKSGKATSTDDIIIVDGEETHQTNLSISSEVIEKNTNVSDELWPASSGLSENNNKIERQDKTTKLVEVVDKDGEDEDNSRTSDQDCHRPTNFSYAPYQLKRKPLSSIFHSQTPSSSLFQPRGASTAHGNSLLSLMSKSSTYGTQTAISAPTTSGSMPSATMVTDNMRRPHPVATASSTPGFSVSTFVTPVARSFTKRTAESPFYPGLVTYGGALSRTNYSSASKRQRKNSPNSEAYQPVKKQQIKAKPLPNVSQRASTSQTAQRILEALESVSSPLKDVGRIPSPLMSPSASPLSFSPTKLRTKPPKSKIGPKISSLQTKFLGVPPVAALSTPQNAKIMNMTKSLKASTDITSSKQSTELSLFTGLKDTVLKTSLPSVFLPKALPTSLSPVEKSSKPSGKMKSVPRGATHYSAKSTTENDEVINPLPEITCAVPLPVSTNKKFSSSLFTSDDKMQSETADEPIFDKGAVDSPKNGFIFTTPKPKQNMSVRDVLSIADDEVSFSFSQPVSVKAIGKKDIKDDQRKDIPKRSPLASSSTISKTTTKSPEIKTISPAKPVADNSLAAKFAPKPGQWNCTDCLLLNKASDQKCVACQAPNKQSKKNAITKTDNKTTDNSLAKQFAPPKGSWKCDTCLITNKPASANCIACNSPKPKTIAAQKNDLSKFAPPANSWQCGTCLVHNKPGDSNCVACTTAKPGATTELDLKVKFASPPGSWNCETCLLRNEESALKCVACETMKPGATTGVDLKTKFAPPAGSWSCDTCLLRNDASALKCVACETKKPGSESSQSSSQPTFQFGSSQSTGENTSGFKLGFSSGETKSGFTGFTFGKSVSTGNGSGIKFGASTSTEDEKETGFKFGNSHGETEEKDTGFTFGASGDGTGKDQKKSGFTFGGGGGDSVDGATAQGKPSGFTFGATSTGTKDPVQSGFTFRKSSTTESSGFKFGSGQTADSAGVSSTVTSETVGLTFGASSTNGPTTASTTERSTQEKKAVMNIAQAAAQGLLKVPTKTEVISTNKVSSNEQQPSSSTSNGTTPEAPPPVSLIKSKDPSTSAATTAKITPFTFGAPVAASAASSTTTEKGSFGVDASKPQIPPFNFVSQSEDDKKDTKPPFTFGAIPDTTDKAAPASLFKFGAPAVKSDVPPVTKSDVAAPPVFSFGSTTTDAKAVKQPLFNMGATVNGPTGNGAIAQTQSTSSGNALFGFTAGQSSNPATENQNSLGGEEMEADSNNNHDSGQPLFGGSTTATPGGFSFASQTPGTTGGIFGAGTTGTTAGGFSFGNSGSGAAVASSTIPTNFQFVGTPNNNTGTPSGGFNFTASTPAGSSPFVFGQSSANNSSAGLTASAPGSSGGFSFTAQPATNTPTASFNFIQGAATTPAAPATGQPVMFNVGATQNAPGQRVFKKAVRRRPR